ncbi:MAG TPA: flagellar motor switch protein FliN [Chloroflexota bacterium]|nr:flagellar motor switch protein FliN [Chloroflexota bacterium]
MAEKAVATGDMSALGRLNAAQTGKLVEFGAGLQQAAIEALATTLDKKLEITDTISSSMSAAEAAGQYSGMFVTIDAELRLEDGSTVPALMVIGEDEAATLLNLDAGGDDDYKAKLEEAVQTAVTDLSDFLTLSVSVNSGAQLQFSVSAVELRNLVMTPLDLAGTLGAEVLSLQLPLAVESGTPINVGYIMPLDSLGRVLASVDSSEQAPATSAAPSAPVVSAPSSAPMAAAPAPPVLTPLPMGQQEQRDAVVRPAQFTSFATQGEGAAMANIDLILDVQLRVTVELGRKLMSVRDILALGPGSVVELDKIAGEPVDVLVNDRLVAIGEVVVADDNFGVRIADIVNPAKRLSGH